MANQNQLGGWSVDGGDIGFANYGGADIPAGLVVLYDTSNPEGLDTAPGVLLPTTSNLASTAKVCGITLDIIPAGGVGLNGRVRKLGGAVCTANGTIATGTKVSVSVATNKLGWVVAAATGDLVVGVAQNDALNGDPIVIEMLIGAVAP